MKLKTFFEKFDLFADAHDAAAKVRELVLGLAVKGCLVPQNANDDAAAELATAIANDRAKFVEERKLARQRAFEEVSGEECPFALPAGWIWTRLGNLCRVQAGFAFQSAAFVQGSSGMPMIRIRDITSDRTQVNYLGEYREEFLVDTGDYLVGMDGNFTVARWRGPRALLNQRVSRLQWYSKKLEPTFFAVAAQHRLTELQGKKAYTTVDHLSSKQIEDAVVPLPPLAEQKRIVAKVDELMALCDRLEAQQHERETRHAALARASLARFTDAPTPANLDLLFHNSYSISPADLRKSILTLAVRGRLVPQDPNDGHEYDGPRFNENELSKLTANLAVPPSWKLASLQDVAAHIADCPHSTPKWTSAGKICVRTNQFSPGYLDLSESKYVSDATFEERIARIRPKADDILYSREGGILGVACRVPAGVELCLGQRMMLVRSGSAVAPAFLEMVLNAPLIVDIARKQTTGGAAPRVNVATVKAYPIPLPPLTEQGRIVAKVGELMAFVDRLEKQQSAAKSAGAALLEAVIHEMQNRTSEVFIFASSERESVPDRAAIGCYAIQRLADQRTFGRTAEVKVLYLAEAHLGLDLGGRYLRDAAGPLDQWIYRFEEDADRLQWFSVVEGQTKDGHKKIEYRAGPKLSAKAQEASTQLSAAQRREFDRLLGLLAQKPTVEVEAIATLFAAWNDFLIDGRQPSDDEIVREVRENWHPSKQRFKEPELKTWLAWLRRHALVPQGRGPHTVGQQGRLQLH